MSDKKTYVVHRAMHGDGRDYARGDTRQMTEVEAAPLVATGALALKGQAPLTHGDPVVHTFGTATGGSSYVSAATGKDVVVTTAEDQAAAKSLVASPDIADSRVEGRRSPARRG